MSAIQKRIIQQLHKGTKLSIKNMYLLRCSNLSRELIRQAEEPFNITLDREIIKWKDNESRGTYMQYSLNPKDKDKINKLYNKLILNK